uniref:Protein SERAC1 n=2 Tax=Rhodosorus marinus TaxID=101924 RepID=A0A7S3A1D7_9RHOD
MSEMGQGPDTGWESRRDRKLEKEFYAEQLQGTADNTEARNLFLSSAKVLDWLNSVVVQAERISEMGKEVGSMWKTLRDRKLQKLQGIADNCDGDAVKRVTKLSLEVVGKVHTDKMTRHVGQMFELDGILLPVKGSAHQEEFDIEHEGVRESAIIANASSRGPEAVNELVQAGAFEALMQLWNRNLDPADKVEIVRAVANLTVEESGRDTARDSGWPELIEELKNDEGPFGQRLRAEATRARHNLFRKGTHIYPDGVTVLNAPEEDETSPVDIVFFHGLRGHPILTWRTQLEFDPMDSNVTIWPRDWLAKDFPRARILSVEFEGPITEWKGKSMSLESQAERAVLLLRQAGVGDRPIVFVTHSYGGMIVKKIISKAEGSAEVSSPPKVASAGEKKQIPTEADWEHIASQVRGTVFFGTPHKGSPFAGKAAGKFMDSAFRPSHPVSELMPGSKVLDALDEGFVNFVTEREPAVEVVSFAEGVETAVASVGKRKYKTFLVPPGSADAGIGRFHLLEGANHIELGKPPTREDLRYREVQRVVTHVLLEEELRTRKRQRKLLEAKME